MFRIIAVTFFLALALPVTVRADTPPLPPRKASLENIQQDLAKRKEAQTTLERRLGDVKQELDQTRNELVRVAKEVQANEETLGNLETRIAALSEEEKDLTAKLEADYGSIADLILALERMRRIPPESLIVRPGAPLQTAQSAMLLQGTLPAVQRRADQLTAALKHLDEIGKALKNDRAAALTTKESLERQQRDIRSLVGKRERLYGEIQTDYAENKKTVERLSKEAKTLLDLINKLEEEEKKRQAAPGAQTVASLYNNEVPDNGKARLPVSGLIAVSFGGTDSIGARSQGVSIEARPGSLAVAPMGGIVRFAGTFKNYGNMVIIEHKNGYHSLIAGLLRMDAAVGNRVKAGEPIGQLPLTSSRGGRPALYYELRRNGHPVDPAGMFSDLKS